MGASSKHKTTMAKLTRERTVRERRERKQARKDARKEAAAAGPQPAADDLQMAPDSPDSPEPPVDSPQPVAAQRDDAPPS